MGDFKKLSDPNWIISEDTSYLPFRHTMKYLQLLAMQPQLIRKDIQHQLGIANDKEFDKLFNNFDKIPNTIPIRLLEALNYKEDDLTFAFQKDVEEWEIAIQNISSFPTTYEYTSHTFYMLRKQFPIDAITIDDKIQHLYSVRELILDGYIFHCCVSLYPLIMIFIDRGGKLHVSPRKPQKRLKEAHIAFYEGSGNVVLPDWLMESKSILRVFNDMDNYDSRIYLSW